MKKTKRNYLLHRTLTGLTAGLILGMLSGPASAGTIVGTVHDFSTITAPSNFNGEICNVCHTPHSADTSVSSAPLWDHEVTTQTFTMYSSPTLDATQAAQPGGVSRLCLSCHDGTVAMDSFGGLTGGIFMTNPDKLIGAGGNLADDHPISITYDAALAGVDQGLNDPDATTVTIGEAGDKTRTGTVTALMTSAGSVQCNSCHDVHNGFTVQGTPFLKVTTAVSALCLTCHNK